MDVLIQRYKPTSAKQTSDKPTATFTRERRERAIWFAKLEAIACIRDGDRREGERLLALAADAQNELDATKAEQ